VTNGNEVEGPAVALVFPRQNKEIRTSFTHKVVVPSVDFFTQEIAILSE
jgi:hypothetical protein